LFQYLFNKLIYGWVVGWSAAKEDDRLKLKRLLYIID